MSNKHASLNLAKTDVIILKSIFLKVGEGRREVLGRAEQEISLKETDC